MSGRGRQNCLHPSVVGRLPAPVVGAPIGGRPERGWVGIEPWEEDAPSGAVARVVGIGASGRGDRGLPDESGVLESVEGSLDGAGGALEVACDDVLGSPAGVSKLIPPPEELDEYGLVAALEDLPSDEVVEDLGRCVEGVGESSLGGVGPGAGIGPGRGCGDHGAPPCRRGLSGRGSRWRRKDGDPFAGPCLRCMISRKRSFTDQVAKGTHKLTGGC